MAITRHTPFSFHGRVTVIGDDLRSLLEEAELTERQAFLRSFIERIDVNGNTNNGQTDGECELTPECGIVPFGGPYGTVPELLFEKKQLIPALQQLLVSKQ